MVVMGLSTQSSYGLATLRLDDGVNPVVTIADGDGLDNSGAGDGIVQFNGSLGMWFLNVTTGLSKPSLGTATVPNIDLNNVSLNTVSAVPLTLKLEFSDTGFGPSLNAKGLTTRGGGTTGGTVSYESYADAGNVLFGQGTQLSNVGPFGGAHSFTEGTTFTPAGLYSLTLLAEIMHPGGTAVSSFDLEIIVPEPMSASLLGLAGMGLLARRRRRA
jgi:hypothetical protein